MYAVMGQLEPEPANGHPSAHDERRHTLRQKVHTPAYASFSEGALALDLNEILDISESGVAIQTATPLELNRDLQVCLDLSETGSRIHTNAWVVWTDSHGRAGIRLPELSEPSRTQLQQWLLRNSLAESNAPVTDMPGMPPPDAVAFDESDEELAAPPDYTSVLTALSAVAREVEAIGPDLDAALALIAHRASVFTRSTGAAIAFTVGDELICHAAAGVDAPPLGSRFPIGSGFSGECVRSGMLLHCEDSETDPRVDREVCRALGIRSMAAVPVRVAGKVMGIIEVFSPLPYAFRENEETILQRLEEITVAAINRAARAHMGTRHEAASPASESAASSGPLAGMVSDSASSMPRYQKILLGAVGLTMLLVIAFLLSPWLRSQGINNGGDRTPQVAATTHPANVPPLPKSVAEATTFDDLRRLAEAGDPYAQFAMGARFATGDGVKYDYAEAVRWFTKAAEQGHVISQATLGAYYWAGRGVPQDLSQAYFWSILARAGGDEASKYRVAVLTARMSRAQVAAVQQQADQWLARHQLAKQSPDR